MEIMFSREPNNGYFLSKSFIGFCGELSDLDILIDNIDFVSINSKYKVKKYIDFKAEYFNLLDIDGDFLNKKIADLGKCEYKILCLLFCVQCCPKIIVLNYFDLGFNDKFKSKIIKFIKFVNADKGINFIVSTNDVIFMNRVCKHVIVCKDRIIKFQGSCSELIDEGYISRPAIYDFIDKANDRGADLGYTLDSKELLKDIYRSVF